MGRSFVSPDTISLVSPTTISMGQSQIFKGTRMSIQQAEAAPQTQNVVNEVEGEEFNEGGSRFLLFQLIPSWFTSFVLHVVLIILLALYFIKTPPKKTVELTAGDMVSANVEIPAEMNLDPVMEIDNPLEPETTSDTIDTEIEEFDEAPMDTEMDSLSLNDSIMPPLDHGTLAIGDAMPSAAESEFAGRSKDSRRAMVMQNGGNASTEQAVELGLKWIAAHQLADGSWDWNHQIGPGDHRTSPNPGGFQDCRISATAMALLPFLGQGQTHMEGDYKDTVRYGLAYLIKQQKQVGDYGGSLMDTAEYQAGLYSHGLASIALAEAYAMTKDKQLLRPAQGAIYFIAMAQDPNGGGWRYGPRTPGDTSVVGWQMMALKSGKMGDLEIPPKVISRTQHFLDTVSSQSGARYTYMPMSMRPSRTLTSIGLLCRMYLGWQRNHPAIERGVGWLAEAGPAIDRGTNMYYNYYATQVMRHYGGDEWKEWNDSMWPYLVKTQVKDEGPAQGSWYFRNGDSGAREGGRLYCTAMSIMTLEVYYRFLPLYRDKASDDEFPLD